MVVTNLVEEEDEVVEITAGFTASQNIALAVPGRSRAQNSPMETFIGGLIDNFLAA